MKNKCLLLIFLAAGWFQPLFSQRPDQLQIGVQFAGTLDNAVYGHSSPLRFWVNPFTNCIASFQAGAGVRFSLNDRWSLGAGLGLARRGFSYQNPVYSLDPELPLGYEKRKIYLYMLDLPLEMRYRILEKGISWYLKGGLIPSFVAGGQRVIKQLDLGDGRSVESLDEDMLNRRIRLLFSLGSEIGIDLSEKMTLTCGIVGQYQLMPSWSETHWRQHLWSALLSAGLWFGL